MKPVKQRTASKSPQTVRERLVEVTEGQSGRAERIVPFQERAVGDGVHAERDDRPDGARNMNTERMAPERRILRFFVTSPIAHVARKEPQSRSVLCKAEGLFGSAVCASAAILQDVHHQVVSPLICRAPLSH